MKTLRKTVSTILTFAIFVHLFTAVAFAIESYDTINLPENYSLGIMRNYDDFSTYQENVAESANQGSSSIQLSNSGNQVTFSIISDNTVLNVIEQYTGEVFALNGNGYYDDKLILGRFEQVGNYNIAQFKILNEDAAVLTVLVEDVTTGKLTEHSFEITQDQFENLMEIAQSTTESYEKAKDPDGDISPQLLVAQEVIALMQPGDNIASTNNSGLMRAQSNSSFLSTNSYTATVASASEVQTFCNNINASTTSGITPSSTMQDVLSQTGWKMYKTSTHFYVMHGVANTSTEQLVSISVVSVSNNNPTSTKVSASIAVVGSCTVSYNKTSNIATLLQYDTGIRLEDVTVVSELVGGTTNFYDATKSYQLSTGGTPVRNVLVAISSKLGIASAIWGVLETSNLSSDYVEFGTDNNQILAYGGMVRAIANSTASGEYLWSSGNNFGISGNFYNTTSKTYSSHRMAYSFTGYSLL